MVKIEVLIKLFSVEEINSIDKIEFGINWI